MRTQRGSGVDPPPLRPRYNAPMRGRASVVVGLALAGCTAQNPAYEGTSTEQGAGSSSGPTTASDGSSGGVPQECAPHPERPITLSVTKDGEPLPPDCPGGAGHVVRFSTGNTIFAPGSITHLSCDACPCPQGATTIEIDLGDLVLAEGVPLPDCARVEAWTYVEGDACAWGGLVVWDDGSALPEYIAANGLVVPPLALLGQALTLGLEPQAVCTDGEPCGGDRFPGRYALDVLGQATVSVEASPTDIAIDFLMGGVSETYIFDDRSSSITEACRPQVAWTAQHRRPPPM